MRADAGWAPVRIDASSARARFADIRSRERQRQELEADALYAAQVRRCRALGAFLWLTLSSVAETKLAEVALESLAGEALDERVDRLARRPPSHSSRACASHTRVRVASDRVQPSC